MSKSSHATKLSCFSSNCKTHETKLYYLGDDDNFAAALLVQIYIDKLFIDKLDTTHHSRPYQVSYLLNKVLSIDSINKTVYLACKPAEYLFHDPIRKLIDDMSLVKWWLRFWRRYDVSGYFYIPNEEKLQFNLPKNVQFSTFEQYDFKSDGIDDPTKPWDEMTEFLGCFSLHVKGLSSESFKPTKISSSEMKKLINEIRECIPAFSDTKAGEIAVHVYDFDLYKSSLTKEAVKRPQNINNLVKRKKI